MPNSSQRYKHDMVNVLKAVFLESICYVIANPYTRHSYWYFCVSGCNRPVFFYCCISCVLVSEVEYSISHENGKCFGLALFCFSYSNYSHYDDVIMSAMVSQITSLTIVSSTVYSGADQRKHQSSLSPFLCGHKWPVMRKMFPFDDIIMIMDFQHVLTHSLLSCFTDNRAIPWLPQ